MTDHFLSVFTSPSDGPDQEYNDWYTNSHLPEVLQVPGISAAQRRRAAEETGANSSHGYLAIYESDVQPPTEVIASLIAPAPTMSRSPALGEATMVLYGAITDRVLALDEAAVDGRGLALASGDTSGTPA